jgi:hypothetical protein
MVVGVCGERLGEGSCCLRWYELVGGEEQQGRLVLMEEDEDEVVMLAVPSSR